MIVESEHTFTMQNEDAAEAREQASEELLHRIAHALRIPHSQVTQLMTGGSLTISFDGQGRPEGYEVTKPPPLDFWPYAEDNASLLDALRKGAGGKRRDKILRVIKLRLAAASGDSWPDGEGPLASVVLRVFAGRVELNGVEVGNAERARAEIQQVLSSGGLVAAEFDSEGAPVDFSVDPNDD